MYNYYMGKESNLSRKKENDPIVVGFASRAYEEMNKQLDFYGIDFDKIAEAIKLIAHGEPVNVFFASEEDEYLITCENGVTLTLFWENKNEEDTKVVFSSQDIFYVIDLLAEVPLKEKVKMDDDFQYQVRYMPLSQKIDFFENEHNYLTIQLDSTDSEVFDVMMECFVELGDFESLLQFMEWFSPILREKNISDAIVTYRGNHNGMDEMLEISEGVVQFYTCENDNETFKVDTFGSWIARVNNMKGWYNAETKEHRFDEIEGKTFPVVEVGVAVDRMNEVVPGMFDTLEKLKSMIG